MSLSIMTFSKPTHSITMLNITATSNNDTQHNSTIKTLRTLTLSNNDTDLNNT